MAGNDDILTISGDNRREFSRVSACIPFSYRVVPAAEACYLKARTISGTYLTDFSCMPNLEDQAYGDWLKLINAKLDEVIKMLTLQREGFATLPFQEVSISGNGLSFSSPDYFEPGTIIEARVVLTTLTAVALFLYGEVITAKSLANAYNIGFRFIHIDEIIRNEIIRFVFEREREMIREKRGV